MQTAKRRNRNVMGKYNVGYHGPERRPDAIDGIATLTDDTLAIKLEEVRQCVRSIEKEVVESLGVPKEALEPK